MKSKNSGKTTDLHRKKIVGTVLIALLIIAVMIGWAAWTWDMDDPFFLNILQSWKQIIVIAGIIVVLLQRIREIRKGEEDEASKY